MNTFFACEKIFSLFALISWCLVSPHSIQAPLAAGGLEFLKEFERWWGGVGECVERGWSRLKFQFSENLQPKGVVAFSFRKEDDLRVNTTHFPVAVNKTIICKLSDLWDICPWLLLLLNCNFWTLIVTIIGHYFIITYHWLLFQMWRLNYIWWQS